MRSCLLSAIILATGCIGLLALESFEQKTIEVRVGDLVTLPLQPLAGGSWEHRLITPALLTILSNRRLDDRMELLVKALAEGTGRIETVRIVSNRVVLRKYFFFRIAKRSSVAVTNAQTDLTNGTDMPRDGKESAEDRDFSQAQRVYEEGEYDEALRAFELFVRRYPRSSRLGLVKLYAGQSRYALGQYQQALADFRIAGSSEDERVRLLASMWTGHAAEASGNLDEAVEAFMNAMSPQHPDIDIRARTGLAVTYGRRGRLALAGAQFTRIFRLYAATRRQNPGYLPALYHAARFYDRDARDAESAVRLYREFLELAQDSLRSSSSPVGMPELSRQTAEVRARLAWLRANYTDYR